MQPASDGVSSRSNLKRYGPVVGIVVLLVGIGAAVLLTSGGDDDKETATDGTTDTTLGTGDASSGAPAPTGDMPITYDEAVEAGTVDDYEWGDRCDTETGTVKIPSVYATPCVPVFEGDNGGATHPGVTEDTITVVRYIADQGADLSALVSSMGADDTEEQQTQTMEDFLELYASRTESYGRQIEVIDYHASGAMDDVVAARADAVQIATEFEPFLVFGGPAIDRGAFAEELARSGIMCFDCGQAIPDSMVQDLTPYVWGTAPTANQFLSTLASWISGADAAADEGDLAAGTNAIFSPQFADVPRKVGVIHFEQDPPMFEETAAEQQGNFDQTYALRESYLFDLATQPAKATELITKYKGEGITTIMFFGDPVMPIYLTEAATEQEYFPEWVFTGTGLTDSNTLGRLYDQEQMEHAFGVSNLAAPTEQSIQDPVFLYRWYFGGDEDTVPPAQNQYGLLAPVARFLTDGVNMAGPELTPETFARGMFRIPPRGGGPTTPQISYGNWGIFGQTDHMSIDDTVEIWWDGEVEAEDERGAPGVGVWRRAHNALRFNAGEAPLPAPFVMEDTVTVFEERPPEDTPPDYEPPPGSPAAG